jgi:hypothetical protein
MHSPRDTPKARRQSQRLARIALAIWGRLSTAGHVGLGSPAMTDGFCHRGRLGGERGDQPSCREGGE